MAEDEPATQIVVAHWHADGSTSSRIWVTDEATAERFAEMLGQPCVSTFLTAEQTQAMHEAHGPVVTVEHHDHEGEAPDG